MAFAKRKHARCWDKEVSALTQREDKVKTLRATKGVEARQELKKMRDVYYNTDPFYPSAGAAWNPKGKQLARGSSAKCDRINSAHRAKKGPRV